MVGILNEGSNMTKHELARMDDMSEEIKKWLDFILQSKEVK